MFTQRSSLWRTASLLVFSALLAGCSSLVQYNINEPLTEYKPDHGYTIKSIDLAPGDSKMFMVVLFSGGGARSAALGYGVLEELARNKFVQNGKERRLFDEVDLVYGVSGGSILAAYYGLHGPDVFPSFNDRFLNLDFQDKIVSQIISFSNQWRLTSPRFGRSDLLEEQLDEVLFDKKTFSDLAKKKRKGPLTIISATDMSSGARFDFIQETFDFICSDLNRFPISRAVAASSAVPLLFSPVTLWNYAGTCDFHVPDTLMAAADNKKRGRIAAVSRTRAKELLSYLDPIKRPYIHLLDGGLSDNLSIRSILDMEALVGSEEVRQDFRLDEMEKLVLVVVNAQNNPENTIDQSADVPGWRDVIRAISDIPIARYTQETELAMQSSIERWQEAARLRAEQNNTAPPSVYYINVSLKNMTDEEKRIDLLNVPTSLYLPKKTVRELRGAATTLLHESPEFRRLLKDISAKQGD